MDVVTLALAKKYIERTRYKRRIPVSTPNGFKWTDHPLAGKIFTDGEGNFWTEDFDVSSYQHVGAGKIYYVSTSGSNSNDGLTPSTPLRSIGTAVDKADADIVIVAAGTYTREHSIGTRNLNGRSITIKPADGADVLISGFEHGLSWSLTSGKTNTYQTTRSGIYTVYDATVVDEFGDYLELIKQNSVDDVEANPGSYYTDGSIVYVHTVDSRPADSNIKVSMQASLATFNSAGKVYMENIRFEGARTIALVGSTSVDSGLYLKNVSVKYCRGNRAGGIMIEGAMEAIFQNCSVALSENDGFNYHVANGIIPKAIEIDCLARHNGISSDTDNGSSMHDGGMIIRVNGAYFGNKGPNVADVSAGTQSWNLGCLAFESVGGSAQNTGFQMSDTSGAVTAWLDGCVGYSNTADLQSKHAETVIYTRNCRFGTKDLASSEIPY